MTYRDLASATLQGIERFVPVQADDQRVMTCFLEFDSVEAVLVTDLIHTRDVTGQWTLRKSSYRKLRLPLAWVREQIEAAGLLITRERTGPMVTLAASKAC